MLIQRLISKAVNFAATQAKVVLITGPRQVGKSTLLKMLYPNYTYVTLDDDYELDLALNDSVLFFRDKKLPLIIDEIQYAPKIFRALKLHADNLNQYGQFFISGSQTYELLSKSVESLAGRICIIEMSALSLREIYNVEFNKPFLSTDEYLTERGNELKSYQKIWDTIHRGSMPKLIDRSINWEWFYRDYIKTYLERDVRQIINIRDLNNFKNFMAVVASRSGQMVNYSEMAKDSFIDIKTLKSWLSVLEASGIVKIIHTYSNNLINRIIKAPKLYFMDTGLMCYLTGWITPQSAQVGTMSGAIFETFVVSEILKSYMNAGIGTDNIYYYRDKDKKEIDLIIEKDNVIYPIEIKKGANVDRHWADNFKVLDKINGKTVGKGAVICLADKKVAISDSVDALPIEYI